MEIQLIHAFFWRKGRRMMWAKNKASSPRLAFPLCCKIAVKQGNFQKKKNRTMLLGTRNKRMYELYFHPSLAFPLDLVNSWPSSYIWKLHYAPMGDLTRFGKPAFWLFQMESLCIQTSHVIIYYNILLIHKFEYYTLTQYRLLLCSNFSHLWC